MSDIAAPAWRVHLGTADATCVRFAIPRPRDQDPWPLSAVVAGVATAGAVRNDRPHAAGAGRGVPIIHRQEMRWQGCPLLLESHVLAGSAELSLELPAWDELVEHVDSEELVWELIDTVADGCDAHWGAIGDGEALGVQPDLRRHAGVLVPSRGLDAFGTTNPYTVLPRSGLTVLLR